MTFTRITANPDLRKRVRPYDQVSRRIRLGLPEPSVPHDLHATPGRWHQRTAAAAEDLAEGVAV